MKRCTKCGEGKSLSEFSKHKSRKDGYECQCRDCRKRYREDNKDKIKNLREENKELYRSRRKSRDERWNDRRRRSPGARRAENALRRFRKRNATPKWANMEKIKEIYRNCPKGYHVDHIIPLKNALVCGLHVEYNLQYLPASENISKGNSFTLDEINLDEESEAS